MFQPLQGSQKTSLFLNFLDHFWKDFRSPSFDTCLGRPVGNFGPILLNFESHLGLQGGVTKSVFGHFLVILSILVSGVGQEGSRGNPRGAQDLILHDLGSFLGPFLNKNRKKRIPQSIQTDITKGSFGEGTSVSNRGSPRQRELSLGTVAGRPKASG